MTKHLRFLFVMLLAMIWSGAMFAQKTETITIADYVPSSSSKAITAEAPLSQNGFKIYIENKSGNNPGLWNNGKNLRFYEKDILHIESSNGDITSVVFTGTVKINGLLSKTWSGTPSASLSFTGSGTNKITVIKITYTDSSSSAKTDTKVSFSENSGKTFTFTEGKYSDDTFTTPTATETTGVAGTIAYSSSNATAISVDASTGALTFNGYGKATITATFTPNDTEKYAGSTDSYIVENKSDVVAGAVVFDGADDAFAKMTQYSGSNTIIKDQTIVDTNGTEYVFRTNGGKMGTCIQLKSKTGEITSPTFDNFSNGYTVIITYGCGGTGYPTLSADGNSVKVEQKGDVGSGKGVEAKLLVSNSNAFTFACGDNYVKISKIEIVPNKVGVTLDETADNIIEAKTGVNVTLKRSMVVNEWNTICLPFDVSAEQATAAFGDNVKIAALDRNSTGTTLSFNSVKAITASVPYLIKPSIASPADGYNFKGGVTIKDDGKGNVVTPEPVMTEGLFGLVGIYNKVDVNEAIKKTLFSGDCYAAFLGAGDKIYKAGTGMTKGFRAYFAIPKDAAASALRVVIDGTATSIKNIDSEVVESNAPVYNLQGQRVNGNNLTPGIYVKAGKKFVVK